MSDWEAAEGISKQRTVLVTGAAGFVGWHVTQHFTDQGWSVLGIDVGDEFPAEPVDVIVSLAATADPQEAIRDPEAAYTNGVGIMVRTLEYARHAGARVLHVSTNEAHPPIGPYGGAKACQETVCRAYGDVQTTIVVTQSLFGEYQQPNKLIPTAVRAILNDEPVRLQRNGAGFASRPFMHVRNLADALTVLASRGSTGHVKVGGDFAFRLDFVVGRLAHALDRKAAVESIPAGDRPGHEATVNPIGCDLKNWKPPLHTIEAFHAVARWYRDNPQWLELCAGRS